MRADFLAGLGIRSHCTRASCPTVSALEIHVCLSYIHCTCSMYTHCWHVLPPHVPPKSSCILKVCLVGRKERGKKKIIEFNAWTWTTIFFLHFSFSPTKHTLRNQSDNELHIVKPKWHYFLSFLRNVKILAPLFFLFTKERWSPITNKLRN
jgi:hypothetical protein